MATLLTSISGYCGEVNFPGMRLLHYLPVDWIDEMEYEEIVSPTNNFQKEILPTLGAEDWLTLPFLPRGDGWTERHSRTEQGPQYEQELSGIIPKLRPEVTGEFDRMSNHRYLARITDKNGKPWLIGRRWEPLEFIAGAQLASSDGGLNSYTFQFVGVTTRRAFGYVPVF